MLIRNIILFLIFIVFLIKFNYCQDIIPLSKGSTYTATNGVYILSTKAFRSLMETKSKSVSLEKLHNDEIALWEADYNKEKENALLWKNKYILSTNENFILKNNLDIYIKFSKDMEKLSQGSKSKQVWEAVDGPVWGLLTAVAILGGGWALGQVGNTFNN